MSRLYLVGNSDTRRTPFTSRGNSEISLSMFWGSKDDSRDAARVVLSWEKGEDPVLKVRTSRDVKLEVIN